MTAGRGAAHRRLALIGGAMVLLHPAAGRALADSDDDDALQSIVVTATRSSSLVRDEPLPVESVPAGEIEENLTVQPGNVSSLVHELPSVRLQAAAPALGGIGLQLRGMPTRDTRILTDGLPLLGTAPDAYGLLQTPPLDLARVEVIQGAAAALYGGNALAGVLNLVSRLPDAPSAVLANVTSRDGQDLVGFFTHRDASPWSATLTAGAHHQSRQDENGDGWADQPGYRRYTLQPRIWWQGGAGQTLFLTAGVVDEDRFGGTLDGRTIPEGTTFTDELFTHRWEIGAVGTLPVYGQSLETRFSATSTRMTQTFGAVRTASTQSTVFGEETFHGTEVADNWVVGAAFEHDGLSVPTVPGVGHAYNVPAVFVQDNHFITPWLVAAGSARVDDNNAVGTFLSPRLSLLLRPPDSEWSLRASAGGGYSAPTPWLDDVEAVSLAALAPLRGLHAERAVTESLDAKWADEGWDVNASVFDSQIRDAFEVLPGETLTLINAPGPQRAPGVEALVGYTVGPVQALSSFSVIHATRALIDGERQAVPLVPRQAGSLDLIVESDSRGRAGVELDYTGRQSLENDPYRSVSRAYFSFNALAELSWRRWAVFVNAVNLSNVRQTRWDPLLRPNLGPGGNPITDVWAPLVGRTFNVGIRSR